MAQAQRQAIGGWQPPRTKDLLYGGPGRDRIVMSFFDHAFAGPSNDTVVVRTEGTEVFCGPDMTR